MANLYGNFIRVKNVPQLILASFIVRLPLPMMGIGLITMIVEQQDMYWLAGTMVAIFSLSNALISPQVSKYIDRYGQSRILPPITILSIIFMLALLLAAHYRAPDWLLLLLSALAGCSPNMTAMIRARWNKLFHGQPLLHTAFSFDAVLTEISYMIGPLLGVTLCTQLFPEAGPLVAVALLIVGMVAFVLQKSTEPQVTYSRDNASETRTSTLRIPGLRIIILTFLSMGIIGGALDVAVVAFANEQHWPGSASFMLASYAAGSMVSGLIFGNCTLRMAIEKQFIIGVLITALTALLPVLSGNVYMLAMLLVIAGLSFAPTMVIVMNLSTLLVPQQQITEGMTWVITGINIGVSLGGAITGRVVDTYGSFGGLCVPIAAGILMTLISLSGFKTLHNAVQAPVDVTPGAKPAYSH